MRETIEGAVEEFVTQGRTRDSAPSFAADDEEQNTDNRTMLEWPPKPRTPSATAENEAAPAVTAE